MTDIVFWEHGHAYQPKRIVDSVDGSVREVPGGVHINLSGRRLSGRNWFELMLQPHSVYDLIVEGADGRTVDMEPITLHNLQEINPACYGRLLEKDASGQTRAIATNYSHPILPLVADNSVFDARVNVTWALMHHRRHFNREGAKVILLWLNECAYSAQAAEIVAEAVEAVFGSGVKTMFVLDEFQGEKGENIDSGRIRSISLGGRSALAAFRRHWLSDACAFSSDLDWVVRSFRDDVARLRPRLIGTAMDAETYGGAYDSQKPAFFSKLREELSREIQVGDERFRVRFVLLNDVVDSADAVSEARVGDYSSWSDYDQSHLVSGDYLKVEGIIARGVGGLCRWTGRLREGDEPLRETYFLVFEWVHPRTKERFIRVTNSVWKVAFNMVRNEGANIVRDTLFSTLERAVSREEAQKLPFLYGDVALGGETEEHFLEKHMATISPPLREAARLALKAYRYANQDAMMSCPTFWQNFDTEITWTSLSLTAGGLVLAAQACQRLGDDAALRRIAEKYQMYLIDFDETFRPMALEYDLSLEVLYERLRDIARRNGYDVEQAVSEARGNLEEEAERIAGRAYGAAFSGVSGKRFLEADGNKFLILWRIYDKLGERDEAGRAYREAKLHEWRKCIGSAVSQHPIPQRVGVLHAKHFPDSEKHLSLPRYSVETETEILIAEAHAYV